MQQLGLKSNAVRAARISGLIKQRFGTFRVVVKDLLDIFGPIFKVGDNLCHHRGKSPLRYHICTTSIVGVVNFLEVYCHLHGLAHPDVVKGRQLNVHTKSIIRPIVNWPPHEFGVGPLEAPYLVETRHLSLPHQTHVINPTRAQCR